jgi:hypothetical protein
MHRPKITRGADNWFQTKPLRIQNRSQGVESGQHQDAGKKEAANRAAYSLVELYEPHFVH